MKLTLFFIQIRTGDIITRIENSLKPYILKESTNQLRVSEIAPHYNNATIIRLEVYNKNDNETFNNLYIENIKKLIADQWASLGNPFG